MFDWWLVRFADKTGKLTAPEWTTLTEQGQVITITPSGEGKWNAPHGGVIIVSQGTVRLSIRGLHSQHLMKLGGGDMTGTLHPFHCTLEAAQPAVVHCFSHQAWLATLRKIPNITQKLLNGMAASALHIEESLSESA